MSETQLLAVIAALIGVIAVALVAIAVFAYASMKAVKQLDERTGEFFDTWQPLAAETRQTVKDFAEQSGELLSRLNTLSALLHKQALQADSLVSGLADAAHRNIEEVDSAVRGTLDRINSAIQTLDRAVTVPATKLRAVAAGISAAFRDLTRGRPRSPERISTDEEMFI